MKHFLISILAVSGSVFAGSPVGSVTSSDNFQLSGSEVSVAGVPSWPLLAGDEIQTRTGSAMVRLADGSRVVVGSNSRVAFERSAGSATRVKLLSGSLKYSSGKDSLLEIVANNVSSRTAAITDGTVWTNGSTGFIAAASPLAGATFVPAPIFRPGPLNLPSANQLPNSTAPPNVSNPGAGSLTPWLSARP
jgi:hypothetical protein